MTLSAHPIVSGTTYMADSGHPAASLAGSQILEAGGNAVDAGVAIGLCINVLESEMTGFAGVAPAMLRMAADGEVRNFVGVGPWPKNLDAAYFRENRGHDRPCPARHRRATSTPWCRISTAPDILAHLGRRPAEAVDAAIEPSASVSVFAEDAICVVPGTDDHRRATWLRPPNVPIHEALKLSARNDPAQNRISTISRMTTPNCRGRRQTRRSPANPLETPASSTRTAIVCRSDPGEPLTTSRWGTRAADPARVGPG